MGHYNECPVSYGKRIEKDYVEKWGAMCFHHSPNDVLSYLEGGEYLSFWMITSRHWAGYAEGSIFILAKEPVDLRSMKTPVQRIKLFQEIVRGFNGRLDSVKAIHAIPESIARSTDQKVAFLMLQLIKADDGINASCWEFYG